MKLYSVAATVYKRLNGGIKTRAYHTFIKMESPDLVKDHMPKILDSKFKGWKTDYLSIKEIKPEMLNEPSSPAS